MGKSDLFDIVPTFQENLIAHKIETLSIRLDPIVSPHFLKLFGFDSKNS
jgi:hypothetical protein